MPYSPIYDYALVGDTLSAALISRAGSIDWLCWPRFDSPAVFLSLLDEHRGGRCSLETGDGGAWQTLSRRYLPGGTNVLETTLLHPQHGSRLVVTDFMPMRPLYVQGEESAAPEAEIDRRIVRLFHCLGPTTAAVARIVVRPTFDYAREPEPAHVEPGDAPGRAVCRARDGSAGFGIESDGGTLHVLPENGEVLFDLALRPGESAFLALTEGRPGRLVPLENVAGAEGLLAQTLEYWQGWTKRCTIPPGPHEEAVRRSLLTLKALTYSPTGAIVAAPTMGLPEAIGGPRNYDYRYNWLRDAGFTVRAFLNCGCRREAYAYLRFLSKLESREGSQLPTVVTIEGKPVPGEEHLDGLEGYRGSRPVTIGNAASDQAQHDICGEVLNALHAYWEMTGRPPPGGKNGVRLPAFVRNVAEAIVERWRLPDRGIWENRDGEKQFFHSKAMCWVGLDRAAKLAAGALSLRTEALRWTGVAAKVRADYLEYGWHQGQGAYTQSYDSPALDAAVLRVVLLDALDPADPRFLSTLEIARWQLAAADSDLFYRYRVADGIEGKEGAFASCGFWVANCDALVGRPQQAEAHFTRLTARGNDLGLFAEEIDPMDGSGLGNFPQGFTHMSIVNGAIRLLPPAPAGPPKLREVRRPVRFGADFWK